LSGVLLKKSCDLLIIGSGLAGLVCALKSAHLGSVFIISKSKLQSSNSSMAQGGIASVTSPNDSFETHVNDTLKAGAGLCRRETVEAVVKSAPEQIKQLVKWGVIFDTKPKNKNSFALTREGGHSENRILHIGDHTGLDIHSKLLHQALQHPNITIIDDHLAVDLILSQHIEPYDLHTKHCIGAYFLNKANNNVYPILSKATVLATGGAGKVYLYTSNWSGSTGDGIAIAYRAGARVANLEFMQFHPTCLYHPHAKNFLISEALRGEGAELINSKGQAFMKSYHPLGSLAPRDIVARSIDNEIKKTGADCVYLDISHKSEDELKERFPKIYKTCAELGILIDQQPIPVVPAAHYLCGGILTNLEAETDIPALFAVGETACTGLHGANRLASNSLLECIHFSSQVSDQLDKNWSHFKDNSRYEVPQWHLHEKSDSDELIVVSHMWDEIRRLMWNYVGIVRTDLRLKRAQNRLENIKKEITDFYSQFKTHSDIVELRNIALVADLTIKSALNRKESRGIHYNLDQKPAKDIILSQKENHSKDTILCPETLAEF